MKHLFLTNEDKAAIGHQIEKCHMEFDINIEDSRRKVRFGTGGHMAGLPMMIAYSM